MKIKFLTALILVLAISACQPEDIKEFTPSSSAFALNDLAGTWKATKLEQTDMDAVRKGFPYKTLDVTSALGLTNMKLTLNLNGTAPGTFTIDNGSATPLFNFTSGTWFVDNAEKPSVISLVNTPDTVRLVMGSYSNIVNNGTLQLQRSRFLGNTEVIRYQFQFVRQ